MKTLSTRNEKLDKFFSSIPLPKSQIALRIGLADNQQIYSWINKRSQPSLDCLRKLQELSDEYKLGIFVLDLFI